MFSLPGLWKNGPEVHMSKKKCMLELFPWKSICIHKIQPNWSLLQQISFTPVFHSVYQKYSFQEWYQTVHFLFTRQMFFKT